MYGGSQFESVALWSFTFGGRYFNEAGQGGLWGLRYRAKELQHRGRRMLFLVDDFGLAFAINRGRSPHYQFLQVCRQVVALRIATDILPCVRWVCSEHNPMDKPSRVYMDPQRFELSRQRFLQQKAKTASLAQGGKYVAPRSTCFSAARDARVEERLGADNSSSRRGCESAAPREASRRQLQAPVSKCVKRPAARAISARTTARPASRKPPSKTEGPHV